MSVEAMSYALSAEVGDPTRKLILVGMANHAHKDGTASFARVETLARYAGCSSRTVTRHIGRLVAAGFIREGDQRLVDHLDPRYRPIVYDVAVDDATVACWVGQPEAPRRAAAKAHGTLARGDTVSPLNGDDPPQNTRGDILSPPPGVTPVTSRSDTGDRPGVTPVTSRGDTGVTQNRPGTVQEPSRKPPPATTAAAGSDTPEPIPLDADNDPPATRRPPSDKPDAGATRDRALHDQAETVARRWWERQQARGPILRRGNGNPYIALRDHLIKPALRAGATQRNAWNALVACDDPVPSVQMFQRALRGRSPTGRPGRPGAYDDRETWGDPVDDVDDQPRTQQEIDRIFGLRGGDQGG